MDYGRALEGAILGLAVGDALGLPYEGVSAQRAPRLFGSPNRYRFLLGFGMISDDTEHACMTAQALIAGVGDPVIFARQLARRTRWWLLGLPAGMGRASLRSACRLWLGWSPDRAGVFSAGNGPCMRSGVLGVACRDPHQLREYVRRSTRLSHTDPKAEVGALVIAWAAQHAAHAQSPAEYCDFALHQLKMTEQPSQTSASFEPDDQWMAAVAEMRELLKRVRQSLSVSQATVDFTADMGWQRGVSGYTYHAVPTVIHAWLSHPRDFAAAVDAAIRCGGDADTTAALVGGIVGATVGVEGIAKERLRRLFEWPRSVGWMRRLSQQLAQVVEQQQPQRPPRLNPFALLARNLLFLAVVLVHALRRTAPPY